MASTGSCKGNGRSTFTRLNDGAADGACMRLCMETIEVPANSGVGRCVAFSSSQAPHEREHYCSMWDTISFSGPGGDGKADRFCSVVEQAQQHGQVAFPPVDRTQHSALVAELHARSDPSGLGPAPSAPTLDRWLS